MHVKLRDALAYIGISLAVLTAITCLFAIGLTWNAFVKWIGFMTVTSMLSWIVYTRAEDHLRQSRYFGRVNVALLAVHCMAWLVVLFLVSQWKFIWFVPMLLEIALLLPARRALVEWFNQSDDSPHI